MTCQEFAGIRRDYARQQWLSEGVQQEARRHIAGCAACRAHVETERELTSALGELARHRSGVTAPRGVESAVLAAFAKRNEKRRLAMWRKAAWAIPIAAGLLLFAVLRTQEPAPRVAREVIPQPEVVEPSPVPTLDPEPAAAPAPKVRRAAATRNSEYVTEFVPLRFGKPLESGEPVMVVRMELPGSQLRRLGLPIGPDAASGTVKADVLLGGDGLAKAIRFVY